MPQGLFHLSSAVLLLGLLSCGPLPFGSRAVTPDSGVARDAGAEPGAFVDGGADAGHLSESDAGVTEPMPDAGAAPTLDGGDADAGDHRVDAGHATTRDGGRDAGVTDAGPPAETCAPLPPPVYPDAGSRVADAGLGGDRDAGTGDGGPYASELARGARCREGFECASGHCADGVCCDSACEGPCKSCARLGSAGTCLSFPSNEADPRCGDYTCQPGGSCRITCSSRRHCDPLQPLICSGGQCVDALPLGAVCGSDAECASGLCQDVRPEVVEGDTRQYRGICCDRLCSGPCVTCRDTDRPGLCSPVNRRGLDLESAPPDQCFPYWCGCDGECLSACVSDADCQGLVCRENLCVFQ